MRKTNIFIVTSVITLTAVVLAGCPRGSTVGRLYSINRFDRGHEIAQLADGGCVTLGLAGGESRGFYALVVRTSASGDLVWSKLLEGVRPNSLTGPSVAGVITADGGAVVAGATANPYVSSTREDAFLRVVKLTSTGDTEWDFVFDDVTRTALAMASTGDGGFIVAVDNNPYRGRKTHFIRFDTSGDVVWSAMFRPDDEKFMQITDARELDDGSLVFGGRAAVNGSWDGEKFDFALYKTDSDGNEVWYREYDMLRRQSCYSLSLMPDGGFLLAGVSNSGEGYSEPFVIRTDSEGEVLWARTDVLGESAKASYDVWESLIDLDGNIVIVGEGTVVTNVLDFFPVFSRGSFMAKLDPDGNNLWSINLGRSKLFGLSLTPEGNYLGAGAYGDLLNIVEITPDGHLAK